MESSQYRSVAVGNPRYHFPIVIRPVQVSLDKENDRGKDATGWRRERERVASWVGRLSEQTPFHQRSAPSARTGDFWNCSRFHSRQFPTTGAGPAACGIPTTTRPAPQRINSNKLAREIFFPSSLEERRARASIMLLTGHWRGR